jgi:acylphosphatase
MHIHFKGMTGRINATHGRPGYNTPMDEETTPAKEQLKPATWALRIEGHVQGVGYRYFALREAQALGVRGYVRNERDGSVSAVLQHEDESLLGQLMLRLKQGPSHGFVSACLVGPYMGSERFSRFEVR